MTKTKDYSKYFTTPNLKEARKRSKEKHKHYNMKFQKK